MPNILHKIDQWIDKIGKPNFLLLVFILFIVVVTGLYTTFSLFTASEGVSIVDGITTYKFILNANNAENSVTIAAGSSKNIDITISNTEKIKLKYGIYYTSTDSLNDVTLGYTVTSEHPGIGVIEPTSDYIISMKIYNQSEENITLKLGVLYGLETGGDLNLTSTQYWLEEITPYQKEIEYLRSTGTQYIDTGYKPNQNTRIELVGETSSKGENLAWFGGRTQNGVNAFVLWQIGDNFRMDYGSTQFTIDLLNIDVNTKYLIDWNQNNFQVNSTEYANVATDSFTSPVTLTLFGLQSFNAESANVINNTTIDKNLASLKLYSCKIYDNDTLVRDFIPVIDYDGVAGLYDKVEKELYYNKNSDGDDFPIDQRQVLLAETPIGSYVKFSGNNGCIGQACDGESIKNNALNGWRILYTKDNKVHLISAGNVEELGINSAENSSNIVDTTNSFADLNQQALKYCNSNYVDGGACNISNTHPMNDVDFFYTQGLNLKECLNITNSKNCGAENDLINVNDSYFITSVDTSTTSENYIWSFENQGVIAGQSFKTGIGLRPVIQLASSVYITGGSGTSEDPYTISS